MGELHLFPLSWDSYNDNIISEIVAKDWACYSTTLSLHQMDPESSQFDDMMPFVNEDRWILQMSSNIRDGYFSESTLDTVWIWSSSSVHVIDHTDPQLWYDWRQLRQVKSIDKWQRWSWCLLWRCGEIQT